MFTQFYNEAIRRLVIGFGSLFNDIRVVRRNSDGTTKETIRVPISYGPKEKFIRRIQSLSSISDTTKTQVTLPLIGFDITGFAYDPARKANKLRVTSSTSTDGLNTTYNYSEVPYNINFGLYVFARNQDDNLQIVEQILPYFTPEFIVSFKVNTVNSNVDVPILLNSVATVEEFEGDFDTRRNITSTFDFTAKSYVYGPEKTSGIILRSEIDIFGDEGKFDSPVTGAHDLRIGITGGFTGEGYTAVDEKLSEKLDTEFVAEEKKNTKPIRHIETNAVDSEKDYWLVRKNMKELISTGEEAIEGILKVATEGDSPRAYEVAAQMIKTVAETNKDLMDLHKKMKEINKEETTINNTTNNALYIGSTSELQDLINQSRSAKKALENDVIDAEVVEDDG